MRSIQKAVRLFPVLIIFFFTNSYGQNFAKLPPGFNWEVRALCYDSISDYLYAGGGFSALKDGTPMSCISRWNGLAWDSLGSGVNLGGQVYALTMYNGELIAGGAFTTIGGVYSPGLAKWNGSSWLPFASLQDFQGYGRVYGLNVFDNVLYVNGGFVTLNGDTVYGFAAFDGTTWTTYPDLYQNSGDYTGATALFNNEIYVTGNYSHAPGIEDIAKYDGNTWLTVGGGIQGGMSWFNCLQEFQGKLYGGGYMHLSAGDPGNGIAAWDGSNWDILNNGTGTNGANTFDIIVYKNELYIGGTFFEAGGIPVTHIAKWDGSNWHSLGANFNNGILSFATNGSDLFIAGGFITVNSDTMWRITKYTSTTGIKELEQSCYRITPTISSGEFTIHSDCGNSTKEIVVINNLGQTVKRINLSGRSSLKIDLGNLPKGIYHASITNSDKKFRSKLLIF